MSGQADWISFNVNTNLLLLRASSESLASCLTIFLYGSGKVVRSITVSGTGWPDFARCRQIVKQMKYLYNSVELLGRRIPILCKNKRITMLNGTNTNCWWSCDVEDIE